MSEIHSLPAGHTITDEGDRCPECWRIAKTRFFLRPRSKGKTLVKVYNATVREFHS